MKGKDRLLLGAAGIAIVTIGGVFALDRQVRDRATELFRQFTTKQAQADESPKKKPWTAADQAPWDGTLMVLPPHQERIGLHTVAVKEQVEPTTMRLAGATDYDPATLTVVRAQFDSRVEQVRVDLGHLVKKGDPLVDLFSTDLADAKNTYETAVNQWSRNKKVLDYKAPLAKATTLPMKELIEVENDEAQSRLAMKLAKDKLLVYGLTDAEIEAAKAEDGLRKATMTLRSRADGFVIKRTVVQGNYYDSKDELLTIAPMDHLWVRGNVSEIDADKVQVGQDLRVVFPYANLTIPGKVEYIDKAIDPDTRAAKFRTSIRNSDRNLKSGMFVRVLLDLPAVPGRTVIPRMAMVTVDRNDYVFVKKPGTSDRFERKTIIVEKEGTDLVVVAEPTNENPGLKPGEEVVTTGSLILEQLYEDQVMTHTGTVF